MNPVQEIRTILTNLEQLTSGSGGQKSVASNLPKYPPFTEFDQLLKDLEAASLKATYPELKDITQIALRVFEQMKTILGATYNMKKPANDQIKLIQKPIIEAINKITKFQTKQEVQPHTKVVLEGLNSVFWVLAEQPKVAFDGSIEPAEYVGLKVQLQKIPENTKWYALFIKSLKQLLDYWQQNFAMGVHWNPNGTKTVEALVAELKGETPTNQAAVVAKPAGGAVPPPPPPGMPPPIAPSQVAHSSDSSQAALFAQLNVGEDITKMLKKVDKNAPPKEQKQVQKQQKEVKQDIQGKPPKRYFKENWYVENFRNEPLIEFTENDIEIKQSLFVASCNNCGILVKSKIKTILLQNCEKIQLVFESTISGVEIVGCKKITVTCLNVCPSFTVDNSESIHLTFNGSKECDIFSAKTLDFNLAYLQSDGELATETAVPDQFITVWNPQLKRFVTQPNEAHFG